MVHLIEEWHDQEQQQILFRDYIGQIAWEIDAVLHGFVGARHEFPQYIELAHPELKRNEMSAEQVKEHVLGLLTG